MKRNKKIKKPQSFESKVFDVINYILLLGMAFIMLYPMWYVLIVSISSAEYINQGAISFIPKGIQWEAYKTVFENPKIWNGYKNTIIYTVLGTTINVIMTAMCAYPLSRKELYGRSFFMKAMTLTMYVSGGLIPLFLLISNLELMNSVWAIVLPGAISTYNMIVMRTSFETIPDSLVESAYLDGANDIQIFGKIILPLSKSIIATMVLFYAVGHWSSYLPAILYLNDSRKYPLQVVLRDIVIGNDVSAMNSLTESIVVSTVTSTNYRYAVIIVSVLPILMVYPFIQKYFTKGVMVGAVKG